MINQIIKFKVKPEHAESFKFALIENQKGASQETGNVEMKLFVDNKEPTIFFAYERWRDAASIDQHIKQPHTQKLLALFGRALETLPEVFNLGETTPAPDHEEKQANPEDNVFIIFFIFKLKKGYREPLLKQFETHVTSTRKEEKGNILFDLYTVEGQDDTLAVYEHWRKESDVWDIHFNQPYAIETGKLMHEAVIGELEQYMNFVTEIG